MMYRSPTILLCSWWIFLSLRDAALLYLTVVTDAIQLLLPLALFLACDGIILWSVCGRLSWGWQFSRVFLLFQGIVGVLVLAVAGLGCTIAEPEFAFWPRILAAGTLLLGIVPAIACFAVLGRPRCRGYFLGTAVANG